MSNWVKIALESALLTVDNGELVKAAGHHVSVEGEWADRKIRPSLLGNDCMLATVKRFRSHGPQPGSHWMAARGGKPSANTNVTFARGFLGEGLIVAALKAYAEMTQQFEVIGCAPEMLFQAEPDYEAHPDMVVLRKGILELIQIKTPSVWAFERMAKLGSASMMEKYRTQMVAEMYIGRKMGLEIERNTILLFTWEGGRPGSDRGEEVRIITESLDWEPAMEGYIEELAEEIRAADKGAGEGSWPKPANDESSYNKWPCSYCSFARTATYAGQVICTEVEAWENEGELSDHQRLSRLAQTAASQPGQ